MWFLGIDVGTTHIKVVGVTAEGVVLDPLKVRTPVREQDGATFHDGEAILAAVRALVTDYVGPGGPVESASAGPLAAVAIGTFGQEEAFPVDADGLPLAGSRAWWESWPERTLDAETAAWFDSPAHYRVSGMRLRDNQTPDRIAHLRKHSPEVWARTRHWVDFGSYLGFALTGRWVASATQATHSQLVDLGTLRPHAASLARLGLDASLLVPIRQPGDAIGPVAPEAFPGVQTAPDATVFVGGHDQVMAAYASALRDEAAVVDSIGTAEYVMVTSGAFAPDERLIDERLYDLCADIEHSWGESQYVLGWGLPTGKILQLLAERYCDGDFERLLAVIDPEGPDAADDDSADGLVFTVNDLRDLAEDLFTVEHIPAGATPGAIVRACVTQLSQRIRSTVGLLAGIGGTPLDDVTLTGSLFQRPEMVRHRERVWRLPLRVSGLSEAVATGAAELARASYSRRAAAAPGPGPALRSLSPTEALTP